MAYEISESREGVYHINFKFSKQSANLDAIRLDIEKHDTNAESDISDPRKLRVHSKTDGYHWLRFWMAQSPGATRLIEIHYEVLNTRVTQSLYAHGFNFQQEGKDTCFLEDSKNIDLESIDRLARFLDPRFALREKFFPDH